MPYQRVTNQTKTTLMSDTTNSRFSNVLSNVGRDLLQTQKVNMSERMLPADTIYGGHSTNSQFRKNQNFQKANDTIKSVRDQIMDNHFQTQTNLAFTTSFAGNKPILDPFAVGQTHYNPVQNHNFQYQMSNTNQFYPQIHQQAQQHNR